MWHSSRLLKRTHVADSLLCVLMLMDTASSPVQVKLVHVEDDPGEVAEEEGEGDAAEDCQEAAVVALEAGLLVVAEHLDVEEHHQGERERNGSEQPGRAVRTHIPPICQMLPSCFTTLGCHLTCTT